MSINLHSHLLANYAIELATLFHKYYTHNRVIDLENIPQSRSRLLLSRPSGLANYGVTAFIRATFLILALPEGPFVQRAPAWYNDKSKQTLLNKG